MSSSIPTPLTWKTTLSFVTLATLLILLIGWLAINSILPIKLTLNYSDWASKFIRIWLLVAILIGLLLPGIAFFVWIGQKKLRLFLGLYLLVLIVQILSEQVLSQVLFPSIVVVIGSIYTAFRLWQLWEGKQMITTITHLSTSRGIAINSLLWLLLFFWSSNLVMLLLLAWPTILQTNIPQ